MGDLNEQLKKEIRELGRIEGLNEAHEILRKHAKQESLGWFSYGKVDLIERIGRSIVIAAQS